VAGTRRALAVKGKHCERGYWRENGTRRRRCGRGVGRETGTCVREGKAGGACVRDGKAVVAGDQITMGEGVGKRKRRVRESG
jgi:hypothetical protein